MTARSAAPRLTDIVEAIALIREEMEGVTLAAFEADRRKRWLVERGLLSCPRPAATFRKR